MAQVVENPPASVPEEWIPLISRHSSTWDAQVLILVSTRDDNLYRLMIWNQFPVLEHNKKLIGEVCSVFLNTCKLINVLAHKCVLAMELSVPCINQSIHDTVL